MRKIGVVRKWGRKNQDTYETVYDYGFITPVEGGADIFMHIRQVQFDTITIQEGLYVTYEESLGNASRIAAQKVKRLDTDNDPQILEQCRQSLIPDLFRRTLPNGWLESDISLLIPYLEERFSVLTPFEQGEIISRLELHDVLCSPHFRAALTEEQQVVELLSMLAQGVSLESIAQLLLTLSLTAQRALFREVPLAQLQITPLWQHLPPIIRSESIALSLQRSPTPDLLPQFIQEVGDIEALEGWQIELWNALLQNTPSAWYLDFSIWRALPLPLAIQYITQQIQHDPNCFAPGDFADRLSYIRDKVKTKSNPIQKTTYDSLGILLQESPTSLVQHELVWATMPIKWQIGYGTEQIKRGWITKSIVSVIRQVLQLALDNREQWLKEFPTAFHYEYLLDLLPVEAQVRFAIPLIKVGERSALKVWNKMSPQGKIASIYYAVKEKLPITLFSAMYDKETYWLVNAVLEILLATAKPKEIKHQAFKRAHSYITDHIANVAWESTQPLNLYPLLPRGPVRAAGVAYCEGRKWEVFIDENNPDKGKTPCAYCPRLNSPCALFKDHRLNLPKYRNYRGARTYANTSLPWQEWSLYELLRETDVEPDPDTIDGLHKPEEYIFKISGWVNRLNEIRARLKCSHCTGTLRPNMEYAKNLAVYNMTLASCDESGDEHDHNIYFNHCWACSKIIDSRESAIQDSGGYYICIHCGSGTKKNTTFTQGDICPKCGTSDMGTTGIKTRTCKQCDWEITLPTAKYLTGRLRKEGNNLNPHLPTSINR